MSLIDHLDPRTPKWLRKAVRKAIRARYARRDNQWEDHTDKELIAYYLNQALYVNPISFHEDHTYARKCIEACRRIRLVQ